MDNYTAEIRSALTLAYRMGLFSTNSPLWDAVDYGQPSFIRWGEQWDSGELRDALAVLREADSGEFERVVKELAALDAEGADIYCGQWRDGDIIMYTGQGVVGYLRDYYHEVYEGPENLFHYIDYEAMARDSILSGDWERISSISRTYYVAN